MQISTWGSHKSREYLSRTPSPCVSYNATKIVGICPAASSERLQILVKRQGMKLELLTNRQLRLGGTTNDREEMPTWGRREWI